MNPIPTAVLHGLGGCHARCPSGSSRHPQISLERMLEVESAQHRIAAVLGCAASRMPLELLLDTGFGDLFVVRTVFGCGYSAAAVRLDGPLDQIDDGRPADRAIWTGSCAPPTVR